MNKCYLIVIHLQGVYYIQLAKSDEGDYSLQSFKTKEEALEKFKSFRERAMSSSYESHISGSLGILNLQPNIIEVPEDNPETLREYIIEDKPYGLKGMAHGARLDFHGVKVKEDILKLSVCDVAKDIIEGVYN